MIIQKVIRGISGTKEETVKSIFETGILCNLWLSRFSGRLPADETPKWLTETHLDWHQNRFLDSYPGISDPPFCNQTPFISTTAGTVERSTFYKTNILCSARDVALKFATKGWRVDGCLFYCYVFVLGKKSVGHQNFAEELRELNVYTAYSPFQPEGEITAKIIIPPAQIEYAELWSVEGFNRGIEAGPVLKKTWPNNLYLPPEDIRNIRDLLA